MFVDKRRVWHEGTGAVASLLRDFPAADSAEIERTVLDRVIPPLRDLAAAGIESIEDMDNG